MKGVIITNEKAKIVGICPTFEMAAQFVKQSLPDGIYGLKGPRIDATVERSEGIAFPASANFAIGRVTPRTLKEAKEVFED